ncbi:MAG: hypothetical protein AUI36_15360 [Cyanobacteria bacterium 13_1_40CM_2_61_4]|nr:MAG: hypothetical protein AUI36_15360 [Cyanobacteria bacterium 13_1_40CM_2_61_4]
MKRWEYKTYKTTTEGWLVGGTINAKSIEAALNALGAEGWELVTMVISPAGHTATKDVVALLKREREA